MGMRVKSKIIIRTCKPINTEQVQVTFHPENKSYLIYTWITSWRRGTDITHSIPGDTFNVSFTDIGFGKAKNVRILNK